MQKRGWSGLFVLCLGVLFASTSFAQSEKSAPSVKTLESIVKDIPLSDPATDDNQSFEHQGTNALSDPNASGGEFNPSGAFPDAESTGQEETSILPESLLTPPEVEKTRAPVAVPETIFSKATLIFLEKRSGKSQKLNLKIGDKTTVEGLTILVHTCKCKTIEAGYPLTAAFIEITPLTSSDSPEKRLSLKKEYTAESVLGNDAKTFSGWMFAEHPSKTVFDHPLYDVWLSTCSESVNNAPVNNKPEAGSASPTNTQQKKPDAETVPASPVPSGDVEEE